MEHTMVDERKATEAEYRVLLLSTAKAVSKAEKRRKNSQTTNSQSFPW